MSQFSGFRVGRAFGKYGTYAAGGIAGAYYAGPYIATALYKSNIGQKYLLGRTMFTSGKYWRFGFQPFKNETVLRFVIGSKGTRIHEHFLNWKVNMK